MTRCIMVQIFLSIEWTTLNSIYVIFIEDVHMYMYFVHCLIKDQSKLLYITRYCAALMQPIDCNICSYIYLFLFFFYELWIGFSYIDQFSDNTCLFLTLSFHHVCYIGLCLVSAYNIKIDVVSHFLLDPLPSPKIFYWPL